MLVVIDTPKGSRNKFKWDEARVVQVERRAVCGRLFPYDFGALHAYRRRPDILVLMEEPAFVGCLVLRLIGGFMLSRPSQGSPNVTTACLLSLPIPTTIVTCGSMT